MINAKGATTTEGAIFDTAKSVGIDLDKVKADMRAPTSSSASVTKDRHRRPTALLLTAVTPAIAPAALDPALALAKELQQQIENFDGFGRAHE
jgi:hypothetical protein